mgnify:CR=1 FL=1
MNQAVREWKKRFRRYKPWVLPSFWAEPRHFSEHSHWRLAPILYSSAYLWYSLVWWCWDCFMVWCFFPLFCPSLGQRIRPRVWRRPSWRVILPTKKNQQRNRQGRRVPQKIQRQNRHSFFIFLHFISDHCDFTVRNWFQYLHKCIHVLKIPLF